MRFVHAIEPLWLLTRHTFACHSCSAEKCLQFIVGIPCVIFILRTRGSRHTMGFLIKGLFDTYSSNDSSFNGEAPYLMCQEFSPTAPALLFVHVQCLCYKTIVGLAVHNVLLE